MKRKSSKKTSSHKTKSLARAIARAVQRPAPAVVAQPIAAAEAPRSFPSLQVKHPLEEVFGEAVAQALRGKGDARHGQGRDSSDAKNFLAQDWRAIAKRHGPAFLSGQAEKKLRESLRLPHNERRSELLGVLVYTAMLVIHHDKTALGE